MHSVLIDLSESRSFFQQVLYDHGAASFCTDEYFKEFVYALLGKDNTMAEVYAHVKHILLELAGSDTSDVRSMCDVLTTSISNALYVAIPGGLSVHHLSGVKLLNGRTLIIQMLDYPTLDH